MLAKAETTDLPPLPTRSRWTIGRLMLLIAALAPVLAIGVRSPPLLLVVAWAATGWIGRAIGRRSPDSVPSVLILMNAYAAIVAALAVWCWSGQAQPGVILAAIVHGLLLTLLVPLACGFGLGRVGRLSPAPASGPAPMPDRLVVILAFGPLVVLLLLAAGLTALFAQI